MTPHGSSSYESDPTARLGGGRFAVACWTALGLWTLRWLWEYVRIEIPRQYAIPVHNRADLLSRGWQGFPWAPVGATVILILFAGGCAQIGGWVTGRLALTPLADPQSPARRRLTLEEWTLAFTIGCLLTGLAVLFFGLIGGGFPWTFFAAFVAGAWPFWVIGGFGLFMAMRSLVRGRLRGRLIDRPAIPTNRTASFLFVLVVVYLCFGFLYSLTPPIQSDGLRYHLAVPQEYLKAGRIAYLPYQAFSNFPFLIELLFLPPMALGSDLAAKGVHWLLMVTSASWIYLLAARLVYGADFETTSRPGASNWARLAAVMFCVTPVVFIVGCWEFIDLGVSAFFFGYVYSVAQWTRQRARSWLVAAALLGAGCLGSKYTMVPLVGLGVLWVGGVSLVRTVFEPARPLRVAGRRMLLLILLLVGLAGPWFLKNWVMTGNPVYPMAWGLFGGGEWSEANAEFYMDSALSKGFGKVIRDDPASIPHTLATLPYAVTFHWRSVGRQGPPPDRPRTLGYGGFEDQNIGPAYLLLLPVTLIWVAVAFFRWRRDPVRAWLALMLLAYGGLWFGAYQSNRFLIPLLGLVCVVAVDAGDWLTRRSRQRSRVGDMWSAAYWFRPAHWIVLSASAGIGINMAWTVWWIVLYAGYPSPVPMALGFTDRESYIAEELEHYPALSRLHTVMAPGTAALFLGEHRGYYCEAPYRIADWFDTPRVLGLIRETPDNDALLDRLLREEVRYVYVHIRHLLQFVHLRDIEPLAGLHPQYGLKAVGAAIGYPELETFMTGSGLLQELNNPDAQLSARRNYYDRFTESEWERFRALLLPHPRLRRLSNEALNPGSGSYLAEILP